MDEMQEKSTTNWFRQPPKQRQKWGDTQILPHVNWGDLFFDLFYVVSGGFTWCYEWSVSVIYLLSNLFFSYSHPHAYYS
jgi:hypothetical protein